MQRRMEQAFQRDAMARHTSFLPRRQGLGASLAGQTMNCTAAMILNSRRILSSMFSLVLLWGVGQPAISRGEPWRVVAQPELKQALEKAPVLQTEALGEPARGVNVWERWLVPNPDGKSWDLLQIYFKEYYGPTWL